MLQTLSQSRYAVVATCFLGCVLTLSRVSAQELTLLEEEAIQNAAANAESWIVRIEPIGGLETVNGQPVSAGPTSGVVVSKDGYIVSSAFAFATKPSSILVTLPAGERKPAKIVATDHSRKLVLLKVDEVGSLTPAVATPRDELLVGQWTVAVGRVYSTDRLNLSTGIVSATHRIWDRAVQTDAKISPANYGGALLDIRGRVIGVLTPMSPQSETTSAGAEWYDSGIGFAVPLEDVYRRLEQMKGGDDLKPGVLGVSFESQDLYASPVKVAAVRAKSPAREAGVQSGDVLVEFNKRPIQMLAQLKHALGPHYAGDEVEFVVERGEKREKTTLKAKLVDKLEPYVHPFLGLLPDRLADSDKGMRIRFVYPDSPAAKAGLKAGDLLTAIDKAPVVTLDDAHRKLAEFEANHSAEIEFVRDDKPQTATVEFAVLPETLLSSAPPAVPAPPGNPPAPEPQKGVIEVKIPEEPGVCHAFIPDNFDPRASFGMLVLLGAPGEVEPEAIFAPWKTLAKEQHLVLVAPNSLNPMAWGGPDVDFVIKTMEAVDQSHGVDRSRIAVLGVNNAGFVAFLVASKRRDLVRAVVSVNSGLPPRSAPPEAEPLQRLAVLSYIGNVRTAQAAKATVKALRDRKLPVVERTVAGKSIGDGERREIADWLDTLDRL